jgi:hypothetical protein
MSETVGLWTGHEGTNVSQWPRTSWLNNSQMKRASIHEMYMLGIIPTWAGLEKSQQCPGKRGTGNATNSFRWHTNLISSAVDGANLRFHHNCLCVQCQCFGREPGMRLHKCCGPCHKPTAVSNSSLQLWVSLSSPGS